LADSYLALSAQRACQVGRIPNILGGRGLKTAAASCPMSLRAVVATNLRRMRQAKGLSQEELADRAGVNRNYIGMLEREENAATVDMLEKLAEVLGADPVQFLDRGK
jgi:ribosome-binding protein aMBF1 (putative translation factor)